MRTSLKSTIAASLAALAVGLTIVGPTPASAHDWHGGYHGHHGGYWGPGLALGVFGLAAGAIAASAAEDDCVRYRPTYDRYGNFMGRQPVNVCQ
jgi:hypothetical protein